MLGFLFWVVLGTAMLLFALSAGSSPYIKFAWVTPALRILGVLSILYGVLSTSFVHVPDGHFAQLFRVYGTKSLPEGKIVAANGENGPQAQILTPGFHFWFLVNVLYNVDTKPEEVNIPAGKVGVLIAKDGAALRAGQAFADRISLAWLDATVFLKNGGQRGPQLTVLPPGKYRLNRYLWEIDVREAKEVEIGHVGVVKSNVAADIDFGTLKAPRPTNCEIVKRADDVGSDVARLAVPIVPVGCIGVWVKSLQPGKYYFNPDAFLVTDVDTRAQVWTYGGGYKRAQISLTISASGDIQQMRTEEEVPYDKDNADRAVFVKMEGWDVPLELRVVAQVSPDDASCVVAGVGSLKQVEDRVLTPSIRAITRDVAGGTYTITEPKLDRDGKAVLEDGKPVMVSINRPTKVLDLINQRPLIEGEIERRIRPEALKSCVTIREVRLGEPVIPPELLVAVRREQLATQLARAFVQEKAAQEKRVDSEKAKATADQQGSLVQAEIEVKRSEQLKTARLNEGQGERDKLKAIADGQKAQMDVLGVDATVRLRQFELTLNTAASFFDKHADVLTVALTNASKFVPNISVGGNSDGIGGLLTALLGQSVSNLAGGKPSGTNPPGASAPTEPRR
jgi:hypothetical protein